MTSGGKSHLNDGEGGEVFQKLLICRESSHHTTLGGTIGVKKRRLKGPTAAGRGPKPDQRRWRFNLMQIKFVIL